jgi:hypothetical protein
MLQGRSTELPWTADTLVAGTEKEGKQDVLVLGTKKKTLDPNTILGLKPGARTICFGRKCNSVRAVEVSNPMLNIFVFKTCYVMKNKETNATLISH